MNFFYCCTKSSDLVRVTGGLQTDIKEFRSTTSSTTLCDAPLDLVRVFVGLFDQSYGVFYLR